MREGVCGGHLNLIDFVFEDVALTPSARWSGAREQPDVGRRGTGAGVRETLWGLNGTGKP